MRRLILCGALAVAAAGGGPVCAKPVQAGGLTIEEAASWLQDAGYKSQVTHPDKGKPYIKTGAEGINFSVHLYDCKETPRCASLQFSAGFDTGGKLAAVKMNEWNSNNRYARAYVDEENDPYIEMDVNVSPGGTYEALDDDFTTFRQLLREFKTFIGW